MPVGRSVEVGEVLGEGSVDGGVAAGDVAGGGLVSGEPDEGQGSVATGVDGATSVLGYDEVALARLW